MFVTCLNCTTRLQLDDAKVPSRPFSVRCPKCQQIVNTQPPPAEPQGSAVAAVGDLPASSRAQQEMSSALPGPTFEVETSQPASPAFGEADVTRLLAELLRRGGEDRADARGALRRPSWEQRRALICVGSMRCAEIARSLGANNYDVFVAGKTLEALELMREEKLDVIVLDAEFDMGGQGAILLSREINSLRMDERRRIVFVQLSPTLRTGDAHAAFLNNVNLVLNVADSADLPRMLEKNIRDLNELYRHYNRALNIAEL